MRGVEARSLLRQDELARLARAAWAARAASRILGATAVGCAALGGSGDYWLGCNVEHKFRSHDIHAETNAIGNMVVAGEQELVAVMIVAERDSFTPCGACLDWIWEFGGGGCVVAVQNSLTGAFSVFTAVELMPHYPK